MTPDGLLHAVHFFVSRRPRWCMVVLAATIGAVTALVYFTGGIKYVYSHSMYVPVLLAGFLFGIRGGALAGVVGGVALGPWMPIDTLTGEMQPAINWLYRTGFYALIGCFAGTASDLVRSHVERLEWNALHDEATRLPNRHALLRELNASSGRAPRRGVLVMFGIENSGELVSTFGPDVLDDVVRQISIRLYEVLPPDRTAYRIDADKLAVLFDRVEDGSPEGAGLSQIAQIFRDPFASDDLSVHGDVRIGCVTFDLALDTSDDILRKAHLALAASTHRAVDVTAFDSQRHGDGRENLQRLGELRHALSERQLLLHYQPKIELSSGAVLGVEALLRWHHGVRGNIPPGQFIPRAELSTLIDPLTDFVIDTALAQLRQWNDLGIELNMAVNISARNLLQPNFAEKVVDSLSRHGLSPDRLELEVTEGALMVDIDATMAELAKLSGMQIVLSIDDFGTGYSSLQYLNELPVTVLKIDQAFVRKLPDDCGAAHIVEAAVDLSHRLDLRVVAEGVENRETFDFLRGIGCDFAQGYHMCRPASAEAFGEWYTGVGGRFH
ncbi:MAG: GGDEF domain-containing protein [Azoarcus sp.]|nr:GGDEF domain-containing protein [Azoarcus sp.]